MQETLKVANWNIQRTTKRQQRVAKLQSHMAAVNADIWILTETHEDVGPGNDFFSCFSAEPDRPSKTGERWIGIFARWPMTSLVEYVSDSPRCAAAAIPDSSFGELVVYGTVLPWTNAWHEIIGASGQAFEAALSLQFEDWQRLAKRFPKATLIVAGDFNQDLAKMHYYGSRKKRHLLERALDGAGLIPLTAGTNDPIARDSPPYACIDHICISRDRGWELASTNRWPDAAAPVKNISDHFGVHVELHR